VGRVRYRIDEDVRRFVAGRHVFFVATAPRRGGHVNVSPKGLDTFRVLDDTTVAYLDLTGSGIETVAHLRDDGRITFLFAAFAGPPRILRIFGTGRVVLPEDTEWDELAAHFPELPGRRSIVVVAVDRIADSCGFGVPRLDFVADRDRLPAWAERRGEEGLPRYRRDHNAASIDGLPGIS